MALFKFSLAALAIFQAACRRLHRKRVGGDVIGKQLQIFGNFHKNPLLTSKIWQSLN
jgi:hypothetical protein